MVSESLQDTGERVEGRVRR